MHRNNLNMISAQINISENLIIGRSISLKNIWKCVKFTLFPLFIQKQEKKMNDNTIIFSYSLL